jgi:hypothetical protein
MPPLSSEKRFERITGFVIGKNLYEGNGTIYSLKNQADKVVKIVDSGTSYTRKMMRLIRSLKRIKSPAVVRIHQYGSFTADGNSYYYYVMDKLRPWGDTSTQWLNGLTINSYLDEGDPLPSGEKGFVKSFVKKARKLNKRFYYADVHGGNIMRTKRGALKFVDLESFTY